MNYPARCTHCISLLKNCKALKGAHYFKYNGEIFIEVQNGKLLDLISSLEHYQTMSFQAYKEILKITGEEA